MKAKEKKTKTSGNNPSNSLSASKKKLFWVVTLSLPLLILLLSEIALRILDYGGNLNLFVQGPEGYEEYLRCNPNVARRYFSAQSIIPSPPKQLFLRHKPENGYRIFVLGESSAAGFPYEANASFPNILERALSDVFPEKKIEVINVAMSAISSYTLLDLVDEVLQQSPDALLIYTGHNEYYGALGVGSEQSIGNSRWVIRTYLKLRSIRLFLLMRDFACWMKIQISKTLHKGSGVEPYATLMEDMVAQQTIPYDSRLYEAGRMQFEENMDAIIRKAVEKGVCVILSELVSNVRDQMPFISVEEKDGQSAERCFLMARQLEAKGDFEKAKEYYYEAKDYDALRFRAPEEFNDVIHSLARKYSCPIVPTIAYFERASPNGLIGDSLILDHLHPNIDGYFLMAEGCLNTLRECRMIESSWDSTRIKPWTYYRSNWGFTELDSMIAVVRIKHLKAGWPFRPATTINNFRNTYTPHGMIDSLAFVTVKYSNVNPIMVHKKLAAYYESIGDFEHASKEYLSVAYSSPSGVSSYYYAADLATKAEDYADAIRYLKESPGSDTSSYAQFTLASIYSSQRNNREALSRIDKLQNLHLDNSISLQVQKLKYKVLRDSGLNLDAEKALAVIKNMDPSFNESNRGESLVILIPSKIRPYIERAEALRKSGRFSEALAVLNEANDIREISYTNLLIGKILFAQRNIEALSYLEKARKEIKDDPSLIYSLCALYMIKRDTARAKTALNDFARVKGENDPQYKQLEIMYEKTISGRR